MPSRHEVPTTQYGHFCLITYVTSCDAVVSVHRATEHAELENLGGNPEGSFSTTLYAIEEATSKLWGSAIMHPQFTMLLDIMVSRDGAET